jgi:hypothetical protein
MTTTDEQTPFDQSEPPQDPKPQEPEAEDEQEEARKGTIYVILQARPLGEDQVYVVVGDRLAANGTAAIRAFVTEALEGDGPSPQGTFVAVPERSWDPQPVEVETRIKIG